MHVRSVRCLLEFQATDCADNPDGCFRINLQGHAFRHDFLGDGDLAIELAFDRPNRQFNLSAVFVLAVRLEDFDPWHATGEDQRVVQ